MKLSENKTTLTGIISGALAILALLRFLLQGSILAMVGILAVCLALHLVLKGIAKGEPLGKDILNHYINLQ